MKGKTCIIAKFQRIDLVICSHFREGKTLLIANKYGNSIKNFSFPVLSNFLVSFHRREKVHL